MYIGEKKLFEVVCRIVNFIFFLFILICMYKNVTEMLKKKSLCFSVSKFMFL